MAKRAKKRRVRDKRRKASGADAPVRKKPRHSKEPARSVDDDVSAVILQPSQDISPEAELDDTADRTPTAAARSYRVVVATASEAEQGSNGGPIDDPLDTQREELLEDPLDDPFFYESPFPPEVALEEAIPEPEPNICSPELMARRRKLRTFVAMVVGVAATITLAGLGKTWLMADSCPQPRSISVPVSP